MSRDDIIVELYKTGSTMQQIGDVFEISRGRVCQIIKAKGITARPKWDFAVHKREIELDPRVESLVRAGIKPIKIARMLNIPYTDAWRQARKVARINRECR
jgi:hypothetical protein